MDQDEKMDIGKSLGKEKKKIKTSTGLIAIFAAVVIFFGGALTYWTYNDPNSYSTSTDATVVSKTNTNTNANETADWKTYNNTKYGFCFKYPVDLSVSEDTNKNFIAGDYSINLQRNDQHWVYSVATKNTARSLQQEVLDRKTTLESEGKTVTETNSNINNVDAIKIITTPRADYGDVSIYLIKDNVLFVLSGDTTQYNFDTWFSTFKFTDLTADWETYNNSILKYSIKYPKTWKLDSTSYPSLNVVTITSPTNSKRLSDITVQYYPNIQTISASFSALTDFIGNNDYFQSPEKININGINGYRGIAVGESSPIEYVFEKDDKIYSITLNNIEKVANITTELQQIVNSFTLN